MIRSLTSEALGGVTGGWGAGIKVTDSPECRAASAESDRIVRDEGPKKGLDSHHRRTTIREGMPGWYQRYGAAAKREVAACGGVFVDDD